MHLLGQKYKKARLIMSVVLYKSLMIISYVGIHGRPQTNSRS